MKPYEQTKHKIRTEYELVQDTKNKIDDINLSTIKDKQTLQIKNINFFNSDWQLGFFNAVYGWIG
jgi:hypothetical protein